MNLILCKDHTLALDRPLIMGVLNVTPDSFSDGGVFFDVRTALEHAKRMVAEGADIIDVGGESTRPGAEPVSVDEELRRVVPVVKELLNCVQVPISIDTMKPEVADACLKLGVHMLNDVTGLRDDRMVEVAARHNVPVIIMHMLGDPQTMQTHPDYKDVVKEVKQYLKKQADRAQAAGINQIIIDPGIGFGKTVEHNVQLIKHIAEFKKLGYPVLMGVSRKSFIGKILGTDDPAQRLEGTLAAVTACVLNGADILRVHDVKECVRAVKIAEAIRSA
ncbi:MAG TPA: dihydropteroate synthase [Candidatus Nanoarchaeia archaeon]|nr:dihydropteroate synthase [Candidatus Nanoarchaeia archaeon]